MYGDGGFYFLQPVSPNATYGDGGFWFTQPVSPHGAAYGAYHPRRNPTADFHAARLPLPTRSAYAGDFKRGQPGKLEPKSGGAGSTESCRKSGVWYLDNLDPCGPRPTGISAKEWEAYIKSGKVPSVYASMVPKGPRNCTEAIALYKLYSTYASSSNPLLQKLVPPKEKLDALWCEIVQHGCLPDPLNVCGVPQQKQDTEQSKADQKTTDDSDKSAASDTGEAEEGFIARNKVALAVGALGIVVAGTFLAKRYGVI